MLVRAFERLAPLPRVVALFVGLVLPQALLGLPIAAAAIGTLPAVGIVVGVGVVMTLASAAEAAALARDEEFRRRGGFFGMVVERWLGQRAAAIPDALAGLRTSMSVLASYVGLSVTLAALTGAARVLWGAVAFAAVAVLLARGGLRIPSALGASLGLACLPLLVAIAAIAVVHGGGGGAPERVAGAGVGDVLGLVVMLYIANVYVVGIAREVLPKAPDGRALVRGSAIGTVLVTAIAAGWLLACSAALSPEALRGEVGTVLGPLADETGVATVVLGTALTLMLLGLGMERTSVAVMNLVAERLPGERRLVPVLAPLAVCVVGEALLAADAVTFSAIFGVAGVATNVLLAIALPLLLAHAARAWGIGSRAVAWSGVALSVVLLVAFATVLSDDLLRTVAAVVALAALGATIALARRAGAFARRAS